MKNYNVFQNVTDLLMIYVTKLFVMKNKKSKNELHSSMKVLDLMNKRDYVEFVWMKLKHKNLMNYGELFTELVTHCQRNKELLLIHFSEN
jgi:hypothetical protein